METPLDALMGKDAGRPVLGLYGPRSRQRWKRCSSYRWPKDALREEPAKVRRQLVRRWARARIPIHVQIAGAPEGASKEGASKGPNDHGHVPCRPACQSAGCSLPRPAKQTDHWVEDAARRKSALRRPPTRTTAAEPVVET